MDDRPAGGTRLGAAVLLLACCVLGQTSLAIPRASPARGVAPHLGLICFYRGLDWDSKREHYRIRVHDEIVGRLARGTFLSHLTTPGRRIVFVEAEVNVSRSFLIRGGEIHYIRIARRADALFGQPKLLRVDPAKGMRELARLGHSGHPLEGDPDLRCRRDAPS